MKLTTLRKFADSYISGDLKLTIASDNQSMCRCITAVICTIHSIHTIQSISWNGNLMYLWYSGHGACHELVVVEVDLEPEFSIEIKFLTSQQLSFSFPDTFDVNAWREQKT